MKGVKGPARTFDYGEARRLRGTGLTYPAIAERFGVTAEAVRYACRGTAINNTATSAASIERRQRQNDGHADRVSLRRFVELTEHDPPVSMNGSCAVCGKQRHPERSATYAQGCAEIDAFCSVTCARVFHGTSLPKPARAGAPEKIAICGTGTAYKKGCRCDACRAVTRDYQARKRARQLEARTA